MKHYQDTETGKIWAFEDNFNIHNHTNRNIPTTLSENVIEKPNEEHFWHDQNWVHIDNLPQDYEEPISSVPIYNPAWITFLLPVGTYVWPDHEEQLNITLNQINNNTYNASLFPKISTTLELSESNLLALITYDGALSIPMCQAFPDANTAVNTINKIEGALFLGGIQLNPTDHKSIECGSLSEVGQNIHSYVTTAHNRFRTHSASISERIILSAPNYIKVSDFHSAFTTGLNILNKINNLSPIYIIKGHNALVAWDLSDSLSNLWISVEQLTSYLWHNNFLVNLHNFPQKVQRKYSLLKNTNSDWKISKRLTLLSQVSLITQVELSVLDVAREERNKLVHSGAIPNFEVVESLWFSLLSLLERHSGTSISSLKLRTSESNNKFRKHYPPGFADVRSVNNTAFPEWPTKD